MISKNIFINKARKSIGVSPILTSFRCSVSPLTGVFKLQSYDTEQRKPKKRTCV